MQMKLEYVVDAIKAFQKAEEALSTGIGESRAITECLIARARLEAAIGDEVVALEK